MEAHAGLSGFDVWSEHGPDRDRDLRHAGGVIGRRADGDEAIVGKRGGRAVVDGVGEEPDAAGGIGADGGVAGPDQGGLEDPGRLAHLAMVQGRQHDRQRHRADQDDDRDHHQ